jgi:hypothetical protein
MIVTQMMERVFMKESWFIKHKTAVGKPDFTLKGFIKYEELKQYGISRFN